MVSTLANQSENVPQGGNTDRKHSLGWWCLIFTGETESHCVRAATSIGSSFIVTENKPLCTIHWCPGMYYSISKKKKKKSLESVFHFIWILCPKQIRIIRVEKRSLLCSLGCFSSKWLTRALTAHGAVPLTPLIQASLLGLESSQATKDTIF